MHEFAAVALGGAAGASARYGLSLGLSAWLGAGYAYGTFAANVLGSFCLGVLATRGLGHYFLGVDVRILLGVGFLGGFTTYSSFNQETLRLFADGLYLRGTAYMALTLVVCLAAGAGGMRLASGASLNRDNAPPAQRSEGGPDLEH